MTCVKAALDRFVRRLRPQDRLSIVTYSNDAQVVLPSMPLGDRRRALGCVSKLGTGGNTNLHAGLMLGYEQLRQDDSTNRNKRVILLTDGLANRGETESATIAADSKRHNEAGVELSTIGVGNDFNHALLEELAKAGRGSFHFVGDGNDVAKVFDEEAQSLMGTVARNVRVQLRISGGAKLAHVYGHTFTRSDGTMSIELDHFPSRDDPRDPRESAARRPARWRRRMRAIRRPGRQGPRTPRLDHPAPTTTRRRGSRPLGAEELHDRRHGARLAPHGRGREPEEAR